VAAARLLARLPPLKLTVDLRRLATKVTTSLMVGSAGGRSPNHPDSG
jgi:hypothetical protein